jgi:hypothetical protein
MPAWTIGYTVEWKPAGSWTTITSSVLSVEGSNTLSGNSKNPLAFGDAGEQDFTLTVKRSLGVGTWAYVPVRVDFTRSAVTERNFAGVILDYDGDLDQVSFKCKGYAELIKKRTRSIFSLAYYRRPLFTKTSATSVEDPTNGAYRAGLGNYIAWMSGLRPWEQAASYPTADGYYQFDQAILASDWSWLAGEDGWDELKKLAEAAGGQLYQDRDNIIKYTHPLNIASAGGTAYNFNRSVYADLRESGSARDLMTKCVVSYIPRIKRAMQTVVEDSTPRLVAAGATATEPLEPENPLASLEYAPGSTTQLSPAAFNITYVATGAPVLQAGSGGYGHTVSFKAQQVSLTVGNTSAQPFVVNRIILRGEPIAPGEGGTVTSGSGDVGLTKSNNIYIQSKSHAQRLADLGVALYGTPRPIRKITGCPYDPARFVGEVVTLTEPALPVVAVPHIIVGKEDGDTGATSSYDLFSLAGLPVAADYFVVSTSSQSGTKKLAF